MTRAPKGKVVIIEDDADILEVLDYNLSRSGFRVVTSAQGEGCVQLVRREQPNILLLDLMLPGIDGFEVCRRLKQEPETRSIPIIIISANNTEADVMLGLGLGADDYVSKPFSPKVVLARIQAVMRRVWQRESGSLDERIEWNELVIDTARHVVEVAGRPVDLTATELRLLHFFASRPGHIYSRDTLVHRVLGKQVSDRTIDVHIQSIRKKLGRYGDLIRTVRGVGYRLAERPES